MMDGFKKLQRISLQYDCSYVDVKNYLHMMFEKYEKAGCSTIQVVNGAFYYDYEYHMNKNGMDKFAAMLVGLLYMIDHDEVEVDLAYGTNHDISDFESGNYDDLFTPEDLVLIKSDIKTIKDFLLKHPNLLEDEYEGFILIKGQMIKAS